MQRLLANPNVDLSNRRLRTVLSRFDSEYPSISNLSPLVTADLEHIVYAPMSDETAYMPADSAGESSYFALKETLANTDLPRRLKPFNLNYHAYAGEYPALLRSVKEHLREASLAELTPVSANRMRVHCRMGSSPRALIGLVARPGGSAIVARYRRLALMRPMSARWISGQALA